MRQPGKGGECEPQPWRGHCYCDEDCGEDSFLLDDTIIGVADGVGGWREEGVDPAIFANKLMENVKLLAAQPYTAVDFSDHPAMLMHQAFAKICLEKEVEGGSATCCLASLTPDGMLKVANLGDSKLLVIREGECVYSSKVGLHGFNTPYQLEVPYRWVNNVVADAQVDHVQCKAQDIIVVASDGLYDNMFDDEIASFCETQKHQSPLELAQSLKQQALAVSADEEKVTPFQVACEEENYEWNGGKEDDITVVVAKVQILD